MSFNINWESFGKESLTEWTKELLTEALNSGKRPHILDSHISIKDLHFGKIAPSFEILEIGELAADRFRGIFKINYSGDFHLTLHTKVQANPLNIYNSNCVEQGGQFATPNFMLSNEPFAIPLDLKLSDIRLSGIVIIVFSKSKGLTLVFRNEPLDSIKVSSTFDNVKVLARFLQSQIENQISDLFRDTLPSVIHRLSLNWIMKDDNLNDLHSQLKNDLTKEMNEEEKKVSIADINPDLPLTLSPTNILKLSTLFNSRESLALFTPLMNDVIQRSNLERFSRSLPTLANSLNLSTSSPTYNGIPANLLTTQNGSYEDSVQSFSRIDGTVNEISKIQSRSFYRSNNNSRPKRRVIKLSQKEKVITENELKQPVPVRVPVVAPLAEIVSEEIVDSDDSATVVEVSLSAKSEGIPELKKYVSLKKEYERPIPLSPSHNGSNMLYGVGLGNNYFNLTNTSNNVYIDDLPKFKLRESEKQKNSREKVEGKSKEEKLLKSKKSNNHIDINLINKKLLKLSKLNLDDKKRPMSPAPSQFFNGGSLMYEMPPPYHI